MLTHYNPLLPVIVAADASNYGIGACIYHKFQVASIKEGSRSLKMAEHNCSQIEKDVLALVYADIGQNSAMQKCCRHYSINKYNQLEEDFIIASMELEQSICHVIKDVTNTSSYFRTNNPTEFCQKFFQTLHQLHPGMNRMKLLAKSHVYCPGMEK